MQLMPSRHLQLCAVLMIMSLLLLQSCKEGSKSLFTKFPEDHTGIGFKNILKENETANVLNYTYFYNGGGVAIGDINNDDLPDILFTGNMVGNKLYINKGDMQFDDITAKSKVAERQGWCTGAVMVDINNDGWLDIYICRSADTDPVRRRNLLFINNHDLTFTESAQQYGLAEDGYSTQASFFDYDKDGDLDMFVANHSLNQYAFAGAENANLHAIYNPAFASKLYRNDNGHFSDVSKESGITSNVLSFGLNVMVADYNNDSWDDIYVDNDFNETDYLFINQQNGKFKEDISNCMDVASLYSMGSDAADYNNDGLTDLITLDMQPEDNHMQKMHGGAENFNKFQLLFNGGFFYQYSRNMLHTNNGDGTFSETGQMAGVSNTDWSWSALFCDFDNDGYKDLFVSNGYEKDYTDMDMIKYRADLMIKQRQGEQIEPVQEILDKMPSAVMANYIFQNKGNNSFINQAATWGLDEKKVSAGAAYADLDNDGDMDLVISNINAPASVYKNNTVELNPNNHHLTFKLQGSEKNKNGIGSKITVYCKGNMYYSQQMPVRGFQSSVDYRLIIGVGTNAIADSVIIIWPDNKKQIISNIQADQVITLQYDKAVNYKEGKNITAAFLQKDSLFSYTHTENAFNDFAVQLLMPNYLSRQGPCMAKADVNNDGLEDIFIGNAKGFPSGVFIQTANGKFIHSNQKYIAQDSLSEDVAAIFFDADNDADMDLYVASGGYEFAENDKLLQDRLYLNDGKGNFIKSVKALPELHAAKGTVAAADIDNDGDTDIFIGGRVVPGKYPLTPESAILLNNGKGIFSNATASIAPSLQYIGMVTSAVWADINNDKEQDLIIAGEWMPVKVFINEKGKLIDASESYIHFNTTGWWNTILAYDFNNDGFKDIIVGNTGLNTQFKASEKEPMEMYYKDFDNNGTIDPVLCYYIQGKSYPAASRDDLTDQMPVLKKNFLTYANYADATITDIFPEEQLQNAGKLQAAVMQTILLQNNAGKNFELKSLPAEAQYAPTYAATATDINEDGNVDIILAGNNSFTRIKFGNYRANHGVVLLGDGKNNFSYLPQPQSGLNIKGAVRSMQSVNVNGKHCLLFAINDDDLLAYSITLK